MDIFTHRLLINKESKTIKTTASLSFCDGYETKNRQIYAKKRGKKEKKVKCPIKKYNTKILN